MLGKGKCGISGDDDLIYVEPELPKPQALYVMQNAFGLIKIGRSQNPDRRRRRLEAEAGCTVALVGVRPDRGGDENTILLDLQRYQVMQEWFEGTEGARRAVVRAMKLRPAPNWPYEYDEQGAREWMNRFCATGAEGALRASRRRTVGILKGAERRLGWLKEYKNGGEYQNGGCKLDDYIWQSDGFSRCVVWTSKLSPDGKSLHRVGLENHGSVEIPAYTTDLADAMTLWPDGQNPYGDDPAKWPAITPLVCCIGALGARWSLNVKKLRPRD